MLSETLEGFCSIPSATGAIARLACARLREFGKDVGSLLAKVGARPEQVNDDAIRLEVPKQIRILELAAEELRDGLLGFHLARDFDLREIGLIYYVIASSERFTDALLNGKRYCTVMNESVRLDVKLDNGGAAIAIEYVDIDRQSDRHQMEFWMVTLVRICRQVTDTRLAPRLVRIRHWREETPVEMRSFFGCDVEFGAASDEIIFPSPVASLPIVGSDNYLNDMLLRYAEEALAHRPQERSSLRSAVERVLPQLLPHAKGNASNVAQKLRVSRRTLSRKLRDERVAFAEILEETRAALAKRYLAERDLPVSEIAWLLGYREVSSFTHAFKRWTGMTPREFRSTPASLRSANALHAKGD
jgi:AraC-like DNA-binding protein